MIKLLKYSLIFFGLVVFQVLVLNNINFGLTISVYVYIFFIILLPIKIKPWLLLLFALFSGLVIDGITNSGALHASASLFVAFFKLNFLKLFVSSYDIETFENPSINSMGFKKFFSFITILVFIHNFCFYFLDAFSFNNFLFGFGIVVLNTIITSLLIVIIDSIFKKAKK